MLPRTEQFIKNLRPSSDCIEWPFKINNRGYGIFVRAKKGEKTVTIMAHRASYEWWIGDLGVMCALHRCDNRKCINPDHLFAGTRGDNNRDAISKGRWRDGERHPDAKLSAGAVSEIRASSLPHTELARRFGVTKGTIWKIRNGLTWKRDTGEALSPFHFVKAERR